MISLRNIRALAVIAATLLAPAGVVAQTLHGTLRDVMNLEVAVEPLDQDARACGVNEAKLAESIRAGAEHAGFKLDGYDYALYLRISSLPRESDCFSSIDIEVRYLGKLPLPAYPKGNLVRTVLWSNGTIIISPRNVHGQEIASVVTHLVKGLAEDWTRDNSQQRAG
jgi:hypothetical protein